MEKALVVALLLRKYKKDLKEDVPEPFKLLSIDEKITLLKKALKEHISIKELI